MICNLLYDKEKGRWRMIYHPSPTHHPLVTHSYTLHQPTSTFICTLSNTKTTCFTPPNLCVSTPRPMYWHTKTTCFARHEIPTPLFGVLIWDFNTPVWWRNGDELEALRHQLIWLKHSALRHRGDGWWYFVWISQGVGWCRLTQELWEENYACISFPETRQRSTKSSWSEINNNYGII